MNHEKRKAIDAIIVLVDILHDAEKQDLEDTPDAIEFSDASEEFQDAMSHLKNAAFYLNQARNVVHKHGDDDEVAGESPG